jgi:hypothetical protein
MFGSERKKLSDWIQDNYPKTRDAVLIAKWFGDQLDGDCAPQKFNQFLIKGREPELLELARKLEAEAQEKKAKK